MKPDKPEPGPEPIISAGTARFTVALFLALFALGVALLIWRALTYVPEGHHWIDQFMGALRTFSTFGAILLVLYLVIAAMVFMPSSWRSLLRLRFQQGLTEGWKQAARRFEQEAPRDLAVLDRVEEVGLSRPHGGLAGALAAPVAGIPRELTRPVTLDTRFPSRPGPPAGKGPAGVSLMWDSPPGHLPLWEEFAHPFSPAARSTAAAPGETTSRTHTPDPSEGRDMTQQDDWRPEMARLAQRQDQLERQQRDSTRKVEALQRDGDALKRDVDRRLDSLLRETDRQFRDGERRVSSLERSRDTLENLFWASMPLVAAIAMIIVLVIAVIVSREQRRESAEPEQRSPSSVDAPLAGSGGPWPPGFTAAGTPFRQPDRSESITAAQATMAGGPGNQGALTFKETDHDPIRPAEEGEIPTEQFPPQGRLPAGVAALVRWLSPKDGPC